MGLLERLRQNIEYAEIMALNTIDEDEELKLLLFRMGGLYQELSSLERTLTNKEKFQVEKAITAFEKLDPEYLKMIKDYVRRSAEEDEKTTPQFLPEDDPKGEQNDPTTSTTKRKNT